MKGNTTEPALRMLITGGAGFIGSHFARHTLAESHDTAVVVLDALTYAGNLANLDDLRSNELFSFIHADIRDRAAVQNAMQGIDIVVHFAAETHNDRAILDSGEFALTDVFGTFVLLEAAREVGTSKFVHISTDEVYGSTLDGSFTEQSCIEPNMPYAASKAGGELIARAYYRTHNMPVVIIRPSNNFGSHQYPEKLIPLFITNAIDDKPLPLYGDGLQVRDWLYVLDNCVAISMLCRTGLPGETYNIGANAERTNLEVTRQILSALDKPESLIHHVMDRPGHDRRYALDASKVRALGWVPQHDFEAALERTVRWYVDNEQWWRPIKEQRREYSDFIGKWYSERS